MCSGCVIPGAPAYLLVFSAMATRMWPQHRLEVSVLTWSLEATLPGHVPPSPTQDV